MKILQICHRVPFPPLDGGNIAMMNMALSLESSGAEVHQFCLNTSRHFTDMSNIPKELIEKLHMTATAIDTKVKVKDAFFNLFNKESYNIQRFFSLKVERALIALLKKYTFDYVQLETLFASVYIKAIREYSSAKIILRAHNVEHIIWERLSHSEKNPAKRIYLNFLSRRLKNYELETLNFVDGLIPITNVDKKHFRKLGYKGPMMSLPLGVDLKEYEPWINSKSELSLVHLASMDWLPNKEGVEWFLKSCWQAIHKEHPELKLFLAGRNFPEEIIALKPKGVHFSGRVDNAFEYLSTKQIMIVPLLSGSGMRVKIIQGLALGKTIISTTIGAEGIDVTDEKNILIADTPEEFAKAISRCMKDPKWCRSIGRNALELARTTYSNEAIGKLEMDFLKKNFGGS